MNLSGCGTALVTPFRSDGSLDEEMLSKLVDWQIESGIRFLVACGTTAETPTLTHEEWLRVIRIVTEAAAGRVPVLAGCTHNSTVEAVARAGEAGSVPGVSGLLTANPFYNKPGQEGQYRHFRAIAEAVPCPVVLYNIPSRTGVNLDPETVLRLAEAAPNIEAIKESSGKLPQIAELVRILPAGFKVFSGDDNLALASIGVGAHGLVSVAANEIPSEMANMIRSALSNQWPQARDLERRYSRLIEANFWDSNPAPVKTILNLMGRCSDHVRLPLVLPSLATRVRLERVAGELNLLKHAPLPDDYVGLF